MMPIDAADAARPADEPCPRGRRSARPHRSRRAASVECVRIHQLKARAVVSAQSPSSRAASRARCRRASHARRADGVDHEAALLRIGSGRQVDGLPSCPSGSASCRAHSRWRTPAARLRPAAPARSCARNRFLADRPHAAAAAAAARPPAAPRPAPTCGSWNEGGVFSVSASSIAVLRGQRRNVLILRGVEGVQDARDIEHRGNVGTVVAVAQLRRVARLHRQIARRPGGERLDDRGAVAVVQNQRHPGPASGTAPAAPGILSRHFSSTLMARLRASSGAACFSWVGSPSVEGADRREIGLQPRAVERRLVQILRGAHEGARAAAHRTDQRLEIPAGLRRQEHQHLLRILRHRDAQTVAARSRASRSRSERTSSAAADWSRRAGTRPPSGSARTAWPADPRLIRQLIARSEIGHL